MAYLGKQNPVALYDSYTRAQSDGIFQTPFAEIDVTSGATVNDLNGLYLLTGTLTSNVTFVVQDAQRQFTVVNSTSGAFTVTVKTAAGTGELVPQGQGRVLRSDGVNVVDGVQLDADQVLYDNAESGISDTNAKTAIDKAIFLSGNDRAWQDLSASRSVGVVYTNTTGRTIEAAVSATTSTTNIAMIATINGTITVFGSTAGGASTKAALQITLSPNDTYKFNLSSGAASNLSWNELR